MDLMDFLHAMPPGNTPAAGLYQGEILSDPPFMVIK
jgi:hypothetical protein